MSRMLRNIKVGDVVLLTDVDDPYYDIATRIGNTFIEVGNEKFRKTDGKIVGYENYFKCLICKKDDLVNIIMKELEIKI